MTPNQQPVERELEKEIKRLTTQIISNAFKMRMSGEWRSYVGFVVKKSLTNLLAHQKALSRAEVISQLEEYLTHNDDCILAMWSAGRPTEDGGYESKYGGKWYQSRPIDKTPKCTCGLSDTLAVVDELEGKDSSDKDWEMLNDAKKQSKEFKNRRGE